MHTLLRTPIPTKLLIPFALYLCTIASISATSFERQWLLFAPIDTGALNGDLLTRIPNTLPTETNHKDQTVSGIKVDLVNNAVDISQHTGFVRERAVAMLYNTVTVDNSTQMTVGAGADWWMTWYVNGKEVATTLPGGNRYLDFNIFDHTIELPLQAGTNVIAVKVLSGSAGWRFAAADENTLNAAKQRLQFQPLTAIIDESTVPPYSLPGVLDVAGFPPISTAGEWLSRGRPKALEIYQREQYGFIPTELDKLDYSVIEAYKPVSGTRASMSVIELRAEHNDRSITFPITLFTPAEGKPIKGVWIKINHRNRDFSLDPNNGFCPIGTITDRGYALISFYPGYLALDNKDHFDEGVLQMYPEWTGKPDSWHTLSAWAWGVMRIVDYIYDSKQLPVNHIAVIGHSRSAATATWVGAMDDRINLVVANNGDSLERRAVGQAIEKTNLIFPHWFNDNYKKYSNNEDALPFDSHFLVACIAPRHFYSGVGALDLNADPYGQYLPLLHASKVYELFGMKGLPQSVTPMPEIPIYGDGLAFHVRIGKHAITQLDWDNYLGYADKIWGHTTPE